MLLAQKRSHTNENLRYPTKDHTYRWTTYTLRKVRVEHIPSPEIPIFALHSHQRCYDCCLVRSLRDRVLEIDRVLVGIDMDSRDWKAVEVHMGSKMRKLVVVGMVETNRSLCPRQDFHQNLQHFGQQASKKERERILVIVPC